VKVLNGWRWKRRGLGFESLLEKAPLVYLQKQCALDLRQEDLEYTKLSITNPAISA
jgi:hypothetical protein